ncbi:conserved hypothetical protein [Vibrio chagasii]|nr:conserved hypothetical protein [Vibrio chagasii]
MDREVPALYKYLDTIGAKLSLQNKNFKYAKPSDFNDLEDLTIGSVFKGDLEDELASVGELLPIVLYENLDKAVTCLPPMREKIMLLQQALKLNPELVYDMQSRAHEDQGVEAYIEIAKQQIADLNEFMQGYRVLCVTDKLNTEYMWESYADGHKGIAIRIEPSKKYDSIFTLFKPISYTEKRPSIYKDAKDFIEGTYFSDQTKRREKLLDEIIHTKTMKWKPESEYRLAIPLSHGEKSWNTLPYRSEEITEIHLGCLIEPDFRDFIVNLAKGVNPNISIFQVERDINNGLYQSRQV